MAATSASPRAYAAVVAAVSMWGYSAVAIKTLTPSGLVVAFYRSWFAIVLLWIPILLAPAMRRRLGREWLLGCLAGGALFGVHQLLFFNALKLTSVANVTIIGALQPVLVLLLAGPLFGERLRRGALAWAGVALCGTALVVLGSTGSPTASPLGNVLSFANLFAFTGYFLLSRRVRLAIGAWEYVIGMTTVSGLVVAAAAWLAGAELSSPSGWEWLVLLSLAIFPGTLGHVLTNWAHAHVTAFSISMIFLAAPVLSTVGAWLYLGEVVTPLQLAGGSTVLAAIGATVARVRAEGGEELAEELAESVAETDAP